jgi:hypothetical protein
MQKKVSLKNSVITGALLAAILGSSSLHALCSDRESLRTIIMEIREAIDMLANCETDYFITQADVPFVITQPGVYCVSENLSMTGSGPAVITVQSDDVVIKIGGHTIDCGNGNRDGIDGSGVTNVIIQGGTIQNSASAEGAAIYFDESRAIQFIGTVVRGSSVGFFLNHTVECTFKDCVASQNIVASQPGIGFLLQESPHNTLIGCKAQSNAGDGFVYTNAIERAGCFNAISYNCIAQDNGGNGFKVEEANHCVFFDCVSHMNSLNGYLILDGSYNVLRGCVSSRNAINGILATLVSVDELVCNVIRECEVAENANAGITLLGSPAFANKIMGCVVSCNSGFGITSNGEDNLIVNNISQANGGPDYVAVTQPIVPVVLLDNTTSYWANIGGNAP